jgi:hypothetical protein
MKVPEWILNVIFITLVAVIFKITYDIYFENEKVMQICEPFSMPSEFYYNKKHYVICTTQEAGIFEVKKVK